MAASLDDFFAEIDALPGDDDTHDTTAPTTTAPASSSATSTTTLSSSSSSVARSSPVTTSSIMRGPVSYSASATTESKEHKTPVQVQVHVEEIDERQMLRGASVYRPPQLVETEAEKAEKKRRSLAAATAATTSAAAAMNIGIKTPSGKIVLPAKPVDTIGVGSFPPSISAPPGYSSSSLGAPPGFPGALLAAVNEPGAPSAAVKAAAAELAAKQKAAAPKKRKFLRRAAGKIWEDTTLQDWPDNDYRIFCGDLGNEVNDAQLGKAFSKYTSFQRARVVRDKRTQKTKGFGFVSFADPFDCANALREMNGSYIGNRPVKLRKSEWNERDLYEQRAQNKADKKKAKRAKKLIEEAGMSAPLSVAAAVHNPYV